MRDAFGSTQYNNGGGYETYVRNFEFHTGMSLPVQVLNPPEGMFDGFPAIRRHWIVTGKKANGKDKYGAPVQCTAGEEATGGKCLACHAKSLGQINADRGKAQANLELVIPVYDYTKYREIDNKWRPVAPNMPVMDGAAVIEGGLKIMYVSENQYGKIRTEHENMQNSCQACNGQMMLQSMDCGECGAPVYEPHQLTQLSQEDFARIKYSEASCGVCNHEGLLNTSRKCMACQATEPKTLYTSVILATRGTTKGRDGRDRNEYSFSQANGFSTSEIDPEALSEFWTKLQTMVTPPSIVQQAEKLGIQPPKEWLQTQNDGQAGGQPYNT